MSLTNHALKIDQRRQGWAERARTEGQRLLAAAGCAAMARELTEALRAEPLLEALSRYLRTEVIPGRAPERFEALTANGPASGAKARAGTLPWRPKLLSVEPPHDAEYTHVCFLQASGEMLLLGRTNAMRHGLVQALRYEQASGELALYWEYEVERLGARMATDGRTVLLTGWENGSAFYMGVRLEDGRGLWRHQMDEKETAARSVPLSLTATDGQALVLRQNRQRGQSGQLTLYAFDLQNGEMRWQKPVLRDPSIQHAVSLGAPVGMHSGGGAIYLYAHRTYEAVLDRQGEPLWSRHLPTDHNGSFICDERLVCWLGERSRLCERDLKTGELLRDELHRSSFMSSLEDRVTLLASTQSLRLFNFDGRALQASRPGGAPIWQHSQTGNWLLRPVVVGDAVVLSEPKGLRVLDAASGERLWRLDTPEQGSLWPVGAALLLTGKKSWSLIVDEDES